MNRDNMLCELCAVAESFNKHHLVPSNNKMPKVYLCKMCHDTIHEHFTNKELKKYYHTIEDLKKTEQIQRYLEWRIKHPNVELRHKMSNNRKKKGRYA